MMGWVYRTWLLYQSWKMKVFCYFSKFLFTCCLTNYMTQWSGSSTDHAMWHMSLLTFLKGYTLSVHMNHQHWVFSHVYVKLSDYFGLLRNKNLLPICEIIFLIIRMFQDRKNATIHLRYAQMLSPEMSLHIDWNDSIIAQMTFLLYSHLSRANQWH